MRRHAGIGENFAGLVALLERERKQQPLDGHETVAGLLARLLGGIEDPRQGGIEINLPGTAAGDLRAFGEHCLDGGQSLARIAARAVDQPGGEPLGIVEQHLEQVLRGELLVSLAQRERLGGLDETAAAVGVFVEIHILPSAYSERPGGANRTSSLGHGRAVLL